jgi:DNA invertase Pin-like site-specific DNA recombinase
MGVGGEKKSRNVGYPKYEAGGCGGRCVDSLHCPYDVCLYDNRRLLTQAHRELLIERTQALRDAGVKVSEIAKQEGCTVRQIHRRLNTTAVEEAKRDRDFKVRALRAEGETYTEIASIVGCSISTVSKIVGELYSNGTK